jgi:thiosulfate/3-mercaptopyruvate sulfurtransferase
MNEPTSTAFTTLIDAAALQRLLPAARVFDCSHDLADAELGAREYRAAHLPGALHLHLDRDLSSPPRGDNGRHPLPARDALAARLAACGLRAGEQVVAYDRSQGVYASRLWWLLRWLGHDRVAVLDGGWQAWLAEGGAVAAGDEAAPPRGDFAAAAPLVDSVDVAAVLANVTSRARLLVDARSPQRYAGEGETLDPVGGHIPGAVCRFHRDNLGADGRFKPAAQLRHEWHAVLGARAPAQLVHQCGSGVSACHNLLALHHAGLGGGALYPGSWSEWCADPTRPLARGSDAG